MTPAPGSGWHDCLQLTVMSRDCVFCRIVTGATPAQVVLDTGEVLAFLDIHPLFKGHTLVIPREHHVTLADLPPEQIATFWSAVQQISTAIPTALEAHGTFVAMNNIISQSVPHLHAHVVPRRRKDGLRGFFWPRQRYADGEAAQYAERITAALT